MTRQWIILSALFFAAASLGACTQTTYLTYGQQDENPSFFSREVHYELSDAFYRDPPDCVTVLPTEGTSSPELSDMVEQATARRIGEKIARVIGPKERRRAERKSAFDLNNKRDRRHFISAEGCRFLVQPTIIGADNTYLVFWSQRKFGLAVKLFRGSDNKAIWKASHTAKRGGGGLPLSLLSLGSNAIDAGLSVQDNDALPSMIDDTLRRIFVTLPDVL